LRKRVKRRSSYCLQFGTGLPVAARAGKVVVEEVLSRSLKGGRGKRAVEARWRKKRGDA
jgi:hypothetical protein